MALRGAWHFNETSGNAVDYGGLSAPIIPAGNGSRVADRNGVGRALTSGGQTATSTTIIPAGTAAVSFYVRFQYDGGSGDRGLMTIYDAGTDRGGLYTNGNKIGMWLDPSGGFATVVPNLSLNSGQWYDIVGIWNGSTLRIWMNGFLQGESAAVTGTIVSNITRVMVTDNAAGQPIGSARVWNHAVTESEVALAAATEPGWVTNTAAHRFPANTAHASGRYLVDTTSAAPYFVAMDSAWDLLHVLPQAKREAYLSNREAQGFNMAYVGVVRSDYKTDGTTPNGRTPAGNVPFAGATPPSWNLASPNEAFWAEVDDALTKAEAQGITLWLQVFTTWDASCFACYTNSTDAQVRAFGTWLGNRYKNRPNLVWLFGGDWGTPNATTTSRAEQLILGIRDAGDAHHFAMHQVEESDGHAGPWTASATLQGQATLRPTYTYTPTYLRNRIAYAATPAKPVMLIEANYEGNTEKYTGPPEVATTANSLRRQMLWTLTNGGNAGHGYGHGRVYKFQGEGDGTDLQFAWNTVLSTQVTQQMKALATRWRALSGWQNLVPDSGNTLVSAGRGTERTSWVAEAVRANDYASAAITPDKSLAVVYVPAARAMTLDLTKLGSGVTVTRVDPTGELADLSLVSGQTGGTLSVTTAQLPAHTDGSSDYMLVATATPTGGGPTTTHSIVVGGVLTPVRRYIVVSGSLVEVS